MTLLADRRALFQTEFLGRAYTTVPETYSGICTVDLGVGKRVVVVPHVGIANSIARYAIGPDGGYNEVTVSATPNAMITHESTVDWVMD